MSADRAAASSPIAWCGTSAVATDREPDAGPGFSFHVIYAHPADGADRFAEFAPRIVGDVAAVDAWWRQQDPSRAPRFDLSPFACETVFGRLDLSRVQLPQPGSFYEEQSTVYERVRGSLATAPLAFADPEKKYVIYYDGPIRPGNACGQGSNRFPEGTSFAFVFLGTCRLTSEHELRAFVVAHEMTHAFGAVAPRAPHACRDDPAHVCDSATDLLRGVFDAAVRAVLAQTTLDTRRDDYYGHGGPQFDVQDSVFLERLDSPDRAPPTTPAVTIRGLDDTTVALTWAPSSDDVGPVTYRVYQDGDVLEARLASTRSRVDGSAGAVSVVGVRALDAVGHFSPRVTFRVKFGVGIVDESGALVRDIFPPGLVKLTRVERRPSATTISWRAAADGDRVASYRVTVGPRLFRTVAGTSVVLPRSAIRGVVAVRAVDAAGNVGPPTRIRAQRLR